MMSPKLVFGLLAVFVQGDGDVTYRIYGCVDCQNCSAAEDSAINQPADSVSTIKVRTCFRFGYCYTAFSRKVVVKRGCVAPGLMIPYMKNSGKTYSPNNMGEMNYHIPTREIDRSYDSILVCSGDYCGKTVASEVPPLKPSDKKGRTSHDIFKSAMVYVTNIGKIGLGLAALYTGVGAPAGVVALADGIMGVTNQAWTDADTDAAWTKVEAQTKVNLQVTAGELTKGADEDDLKWW